MAIDWVYALDACAAGGVLDYDAPADILDQPSRYVGHPKYSDLPTINTALLPEGTKLKEGPERDEFKNQSLVENPTWKKWLFGGLAAGAVVVTTLAILTKKGKIKMPSMPKLSGIGTTLKNIGAKIWHYIKMPFVYIGKLFSKKP